MQVLVVVDMQNDFVDGVLGTKEAAGIVQRAAEKIRNFTGCVVFTQDTHDEEYLQTQEGKYLPVRHCLRASSGWELHPEIARLRGDCRIFEKGTFGSVELGEWLKEENKREKIDCVTLIGLCTDICVISNAMLIKAFLPEARIEVDASCCAGVTPESHKRALDCMRSCQIQVVYPAE